MTEKDLEKLLTENFLIEKLCLKKLSDYPSGTLNVFKKGQKEYYLYRNEKNREYLTERDCNLIRTLIEKDYCKKLLKTSQDNQKVIKNALKNVKQIKDLASVFLNIPKDRAVMISPFVIEKKERKFRFNNSRQLKYEVSEALKTKGGEYVRSKSELIIADRLFDYGIQYCYEGAIQLETLEIIHPDFTVMNKSTGKIYYWEHFGMIDNPDYSVGMQKKLEAYAKNGYFFGENLLISVETRTQPVNTDYIELLIDRYLL